MEHFSISKKIPGSRHLAPCALLHGNGGALQSHWDGDGAIWGLLRMVNYVKPHKPTIWGWYGGWRKSCTTWDGWNPRNNGINHLSTGAGFPPSTVVPTHRVFIRNGLLGLLSLCLARERVFNTIVPRPAGESQIIILSFSWLFKLFNHSFALAQKFMMSESSSQSWSWIFMASPRCAQARSVWRGPGRFVARCFHRHMGSAASAPKTSAGQTGQTAMGYPSETEKISASDDGMVTKGDNQGIVDITW